MPVHYTTTREAAHGHGVKFCIHGRAGAGKTTLVRTLPRPLLISAESGVLSLGDQDIITAVINSIADLEEVYNYLTMDPSARERFDSVALDSITEIAEVCLVEQKRLHKDGRKAYGEMGDIMSEWIRKFRDLAGFHVYFSAQQSYNKDEVSGISRYGPSMPGQKMTGKMPFFFDELFSLEVGRDAEGNDFRFLQTNLTIQFEAKDRSGALEAAEYPDLGYIINKIQAHLARTAAQPTPA